MVQNGQREGMVVGPSYSNHHDPAPVYDLHTALPPTNLTPGFEHLTASMPLYNNLPPSQTIDNNTEYHAPPLFPHDPTAGPSFISPPPLQPQYTNGLGLAPQFSHQPGAPAQFMPAIPDQMPMPQPGFTFGHPPPPRDLWPNHPEWDDERFAMDYGDGGDMIYGQLEVSLQAALSSFLLSTSAPGTDIESPLSSPASTIPSPTSTTSTFSPLSQGAPVVLPPQDGPIGDPNGIGVNLAPGKSFPSVPPPSAPASPTSPTFLSRLPFKARFPNPPLHPSNVIGEGEQWTYRTLQGQQADFVPPLKVKHRRRTTPEQLKVLEHWFDVNPKPDNNLREWLAMELGMTKRNVQVWFQNRSVDHFTSPCTLDERDGVGLICRRAKVKGLALKEKAAAAKAADGEGEQVSDDRPETPPTTHPPAVMESLATPSPPDKQPQQQHMPHRPPPLQLHSQPQLSLLPPVNPVNMGRRVSLANGEAARIETFIAKQRMMARKASNGGSIRAPGYISPVRSPIIAQHQANLARRTSIPYPSPLEIRPSGLPNGPGSPKPSPSVRPMPSALHLAAIRNNTRRSSMPGIAQAQLISSGPFTPPRMVSGSMMHPNGQQVGRELGPIKDVSPEAPNVAHLPQDGFVFSEPSDLSTTYLTPPSSTYLPSTSPSTYLPSDGSSTIYDFGIDQSQFPPYTPNGPLPNPSFSFGSAPQSVPAPMLATDEQVNMYYNMQNRGRLGSIASIGTYTTDGGATADGSDWDWSGVAPPQVDMDGFDPDTRRASA